MAVSTSRLSKYHQSVLIFLFSSLLVICLAVKESEKSLDSDLVVASSITVNSYKIQATAPRSSGDTKYGYPFLIAPTLTPVINSRSDDEDENESVVPVALVKAYGSKLEPLEREIVPVKKGNPKKQKTPYIYGATRRQGYEDTIDEQRLRRYKEPKYRNFDELENGFKPRIDINIPYSEYYLRKERRPLVSPRDPYLSPSKEPVDTFYPLPKSKSYSTPYRQSAKSTSGYGAGPYRDSQSYQSGYSPSSYQESGYEDQSNYPSSEYDSGYETPSKYPPGGAPYNYQEDYAIESNKPITGDIRKRLLDYAGASDLYEGEPDYLREVGRNKHKYGQIGNDYYAYGGPEYKNSYRDFPYVESKISRVKKFRTS